MKNQIYICMYACSIAVQSGFTKPVGTGPVWPVGLGRYQTGPNSKFKFEFKKMKNSQKKS